MKCSLIIAVASNGVIGLNGKLPWQIPADLNRFTAFTWAKPIIMGMNTHKSIGKVLNGRANIVITRHPEQVLPGAYAVPTLKDAIIKAKCNTHKIVEYFIIGGAQVYEEFIRNYPSLIDRIYLTRIYKSFRGDTYFPFWNNHTQSIILPQIEGKYWSITPEEVKICQPLIGNAFKYQFVIYEKVDDSYNLARKI